MLEAVAICLDRAVIVYAGGEIAPVCGRKRFPRKRLEIHHVERLLQLGDGGRLLSQRIQIPEQAVLTRPRHPRPREHRTAG